MTAVSEPRQALSGVTVLDLATYLAASACATLLGEFGADVIKVEQPGVGDDLRRLGRPVAPSAGGSFWWFVESRNKKSITCNLRVPEGQALIRRLVQGTHVVTENFRPGTLERWHLGWSELAPLRPSLVMVRISAFGQTGPNRERPGFGRIAAAVGGLAYLAGYPDRAPVSPGTSTGSWPGGSASATRRRRSRRWRRRTCRPPWSRACAISSRTRTSVRARTSSPRCCRCSAGSRCRGSFRASPPRRDGSRAPGRRRPASTTRRSTAAGWGSRRPS